MITSQHITLFIVFITISHYILQPQGPSIKGLLYLKQLFDERCQPKALTARSIPGLSYLNYLKTLYHQFNNVNVTACQPIDLSTPGKPSAALIAGMSHLYTKNSTTKYFTKSLLANELLIESILIKRHLTDLSAFFDMDQLWIYVPLALFIVYPFLHDSTVFCYRSIEDYLFDGGSTRINNNHVFIHESTTEASNTPAKQTSTTISRRSSADSSTGTIHLDYTSTTAQFMTPYEFLAEEVKAAGPPKRRDEIPFEPTKSQKFWSDSLSGEPSPFGISGLSSDSNGHRFQFPTAPGCPCNEKNSMAQDGIAVGHPATVTNPNPPKSGLKASPSLGSSLLRRYDFFDMSYVSPTGSVSERSPEFAKDNTQNISLSLLEFLNTIDSLYPDEKLENSHHIL